MSQTTARNRESQQVFRLVNENIDAVQSRLGPLDQLELLCECGDPNCSRRVYVSPDVYAEIRSHPLRFLFAAEHQIIAGESLIESHPLYLVIEIDPTTVASSPSALANDPVI